MRAPRLTVLLALLAGCPDRTISKVTPEQGKVEVKDIPAIPRRDLDILFMIDDSLSMKDEQESLRANFSRLIGVLQSVDGGLPDVQIGVITPNLGTSATDGSTAMTIGGCAGQGEGGTLRAQFPGGPRFLRDVDDHAGGRSRNYTGTLEEAFASLATVGTAGCGIEQHLEAIKRALDGSNPDNAGFVRKGAYLAIVIIADEDDCSLAKSTLFAGNPGDPTYGDRVNFRCTSQGVACDSPSTPFEDATGIRQDCHPSFDPASELTQIDRYVTALKGLKAEPRDVIVAGIVGQPDPFDIGKKGDTTVLNSSCPAGTGAIAFPAVRMADFLSQFQERNTRASICEADLSGALTQIGALIKDTVVDPCFDNTLLDADPLLPGPQYDCSVVEIRRTTGNPDEPLRVFGPCGTGSFPCWRIEEDAVNCSYTTADPHLKLVIDRNGEPIGADTRVEASCVTAGDASGPPT
jgi:hypothetical protein